MFDDPLLWAPAAVSLVAPAAAAWRCWAGRVLWLLAATAALAGFVLVAAAAALLGAFGSLVVPAGPLHWSTFLPPAALSASLLALSAAATSRVCARPASSPGGDEGVR